MSDTLHYKPTYGHLHGNRFPYNYLYKADVTELLEAVFSIIIKTQKYSIEPFFRGFMNCMWRRAIDDGCPRPMNMAIDEMIDSLEDNCPEIFVPATSRDFHADGVYKMDPFLAGWICGKYNEMQYYLNIPSSVIYDLYPLDTMLKVFPALHTIDDLLAVEKMVKGVNAELNRRGQPEIDLSACDFGD